ncbi:MAG: hypothetical protein A2020_07645 [Lentisphaerae bacterium GWF2_45_14]|nr:MAG: hypothetical protein A2020_07645 [Lentisphaerae bacterium GWF2_45_14]
MKTALLFFLLIGGLAAAELPPEGYFMDAIDKANVESYRARANARVLASVWSDVRKKVNAILAESGIESPVSLVIEWGGGYSGNYHCCMVFKDASAFVAYISEGKLSSIRIDKGNEEVKKIIGRINVVAEALAYRNGSLGSSGCDKTYYFITFYFRNPWSSHDGQNSFAYEDGMFFRYSLLDYVPRYLYAAYKKQLEDKKFVKSEKELADDARKAFGIIVK